MKTINKFFSLVAVAGALVAFPSCSSESIDYPSELGIVDASQYTINVTVNQETNEWSATVDNAPKGVRLLWTVYEKGVDKKPTVTVAESVAGQILKKGDYPIELQLMNHDGVSPTKATATIHIENTLGGGFVGYDYQSPSNLWKNCDITPSLWFANDGWSQIDDPADLEITNAEILFTCPGGMGASQWQGQVHLATNIPVSAAESYDFSIYINPSEDANVTVKVQKDGADDTYFVQEVVPFKAGGSFYHFANREGFDGNLNLTLDFGGNAGKSFTIQNIVFKKHSESNPVVLPDTPVCNWVGADSDQNLWKDAKFTIETWTSGADWSGSTAEPSIEEEGNAIKLTYTEAPGADQWKAQVKLISDLTLDASKTYDFRVTLGCTANLQGATIKLTNKADDGTAYVDTRVNLYANGDIPFGFVNLTGKQLTDVMLVLDFGGIEQGATVTVKDIIIQEQK